MAKRIQIRRDTAANWTAANPVLAQGEIGIELDGLGTSTVLQKIGDGVTAWDSLPYQQSGGGGGVQSVTGDGVGGTANNPVLSFPNASEVDNDSGVTGSSVKDALETLQQEIPNPNNLVNQFTTDTQGVSGRFTVQTPLDSNTSDAASVGYVLGKTNDKVSSNTTGEPTGTDVVLNVVSLTQAEYDAGTPIATTFYLITDA